MCICTQILHSKHTDTLRAEVVTSIWGNGDTGPLFVHLPESGASAQFVADVNTKFGGKLKVVISRTGSHFMNAEATIVYYEEPSAQVVCVCVSLLAVENLAVSQRQPCRLRSHWLMCVDRDYRFEMSGATLGVNTHTHTDVRMYIYIQMHTYREREREPCIHIYIYINIYIYIYVYTSTHLQT